MLTRNVCLPGSREKLQAVESPDKLLFSSMATIARLKPHWITETSEAGRSAPGYALTALPNVPPQPTYNCVTMGNRAQATVSFRIRYPPLANSSAIKVPACPETVDKASALTSGVQLQPSAGPRWTLSWAAPAAERGLRQKGAWRA